MGKIVAVVMPEPNQPVELRELEEPDLEVDSALLEVQLSEVCGTDVYLQQGRLEGVPYPLIPGHVSVGRLCKIRGKMLDIEGRAFQEGDRVTFLDVHGTCGACWYCLVAKAGTRCPHRKVYGITYGVQDGPSGGWAQKIYLKPQTRCIRLDGVDLQRFMAGGCSLPTALHAIDRAGLGLGDTVLVLGSGPVGLSTVILARLQGVRKVLCIGAPLRRLQTALQVGAHAVLNFEETPEKERQLWVLEQTNGRGADVSIEATGQPAAVVQALRWTRDAGRVVIVGQYTDHGEIPFNPHLDLNRKHLEILGCWGSEFSHFFRGVEIMADEAASEPWSRIGLDRYDLTQAQKALDDVALGRAVKALIDPQSA